MLKGKIQGKKRLLFPIVALLYAGSFFFPLWKISLDAPQYPEGLGMYIWINRVTGETPHDLQNINLLNHYIGMKHIDSETIPELQIMPFLLGGVVLAALLGFAFPWRKYAFVTLILLLVLTVAGLIDFTLWEYDYGHTLNPDAPIIIPGMSYQPPLIFCKQLLNITSCSFPWTGSLWIGAVVLLTIYTMIPSQKNEV